ncbi:hypothetical protein NKH18_45340 [Streptomyces sp. M10(2022)]
MKNYTDWPGWTDDFAEKTRPVYEKNNASCQEIAGALSEALVSLVTATLGNLQNIEGTQSYAQEQVDRQGSQDDAG